jgi:hypothetical protein
MFGQQTLYQGAVADVAVYKLVLLIALQACEIFQIAGIGELVEDDGKTIN